MRADLDAAKETIIKLLEAGVSRREICTRYKCKTDTLTGRLKAWGCNHLKNQAGKGRPRFGARRAATTYLTQNSTFTSHQLKKVLWRDEIKPRHCEECGWARTSEDGRLPLELHHVNGNRFDNRLENLLILCPNCHALKPNNSGANAGKYPND